MQQWQNMINTNPNNPNNPNNPIRYHTSYSQQPEVRGVLNQFVDPKYLKAMNSMEAEPLRPNYSLEVENSTSFLNNFQRKR